MKDYKRILQGVVNIINTTEKSDIGFVNICTYIGENCPELNESEDERIRNLIYLSIEKGMGIPNEKDRKKALAWLEKQGEQKAIEKFPKYKKGDILTDGKNKYEVLSWDYTETGIAAYYMKGVGCKFSWSCEEADKKLHLVEQKPADKVEPKFKVGDWVVYENRVGLIVRMLKEHYIISFDGVEEQVSFIFNDKITKWTIQDAKDGDVIVWDNGRYTIIFKELKDNRIIAHCSYNNHSKHFETQGNYDTTFDSNLKFIPITKEQRDTLFEKMREAGYEWDAEKKELKEIKKKPKKCMYSKDDYTDEDRLVLCDGCDEICELKQNTAWSEEDEMFVHGLIRGLTAKRDIHGHTTFSSDCIDITETINWLISLKYRVQPKQEWSALDERNLQGVIDEIKANKNNAPDYDLETYDRFLNWLKSLKPQNTWKPSDEQMKALSIAMCGVDDPLFSLYQDLKKLREE